MEQQNVPVKTISQEGDKATYPSIGSMIEMHYTGYLYDATKPDGKGKKFDSSYDRNAPLASPIGKGRLIAGWDECVPQMSLGEVATLNIPSSHGYGDRGYPPVIPGGSRLIFDVKLMAIGTKKVDTYPN